MPNLKLGDWLQDSARWAEDRMKRALESTGLGPDTLEEALRYPLFAGGKRLRPALVRMVCSGLGGDDAQASAPAVAIEMVHTYSLVHDDLPCMDDDDLRRGKPTTHAVYGEATGVLVGDGLLTMAFEHLAGSGHPRALEMIRVLAGAAGPAGMVGGQHLDLAAEGQSTDTEGVRRIHRMKTAALIAGACELGALAADSPGEAQRHARQYGMSLGLCFQAVDDCLDVTGKAQDLGKTPGKDQAAGKATLVSGLGLEGAQMEAGQRAQEALAAARAGGFGDSSLAEELVGWLLARRS